MGIAIVLRNQLTINRFRDLLVGSISTGAGDEALLCSGFFQENRGKHPPLYRATLENNFARVVAKAKLEMTTVGVYNHYWKQSYREFKNNMVAAGANISCFYKSGLKWHAKVFVLSKAGVPVFGIIGSSNITRPAFGSVKNFNYECDVILWPDEQSIISSWLEEQLQEDDFPFEIIRAPYIEEMNNGLAVQDRLQNLKDEIMESGLSVLE